MSEDEGHVPEHIPWWHPLRRWSARRMHNDRDYDCYYWWGDRGGYDLASQRCIVCNPAPKESA